MAVNDHFSEALTTFVGTARFEVLDRLGAGGMGVVYRVFDRERGVSVALKCMQKLGASALVRFKNEFRALQDVQHPNLVRLGELMQDGDRWFFTMELVEGVDFLSYVRKGESTGRRTATLREGNNTSTEATSEACSAVTAVQSGPKRIGAECIEGRLRAVLGQLTRGLQCLHEAGKVHRDIKPSNILVTEAERVVLLDFGLIVDAEDSIWQDRNLVGTVGYMAPEQAAGTDLGPATDWYSVGVLLYLSLTGYPPLGAGGMPPAPHTVDTAVPEDLSLLSLRLLEKDPDKRAGAEQIFAVLGEDAASVPSARADATGVASVCGFVGREKELATLADAYAAVKQHPVTVLVCGESGIGKSSLVRRFLHDVSQGDVLILQAKCYEREAAAYKGVDGIVDAISQHLAPMPLDEVATRLPDDLAFLARLFPALQRLKPIQEALTTSLTGISQQEQRWRGFRALRALLRNLCERQRVVVSIDDLQWAGSDSWQLLAELVRAPDAPRFLLIGTQRGLLVTDSGDGAQGVEYWPGKKRIMVLGGLEKHAARELIAELLPKQVAESREQELIAESGGHPLFLTELCHFARVNEGDGGLLLERALTTRLDALAHDQRCFLELVALAGAPVVQKIAVLAVNLSGSRVEETLQLLINERFLQTQGMGPSDTVEPYHDRIRSTILANLDPNQQKFLHASLATALEQAAVADAQLIATHWQGAGKLDRACVFWIRAADQAAEALAFERAAQLYREALDLQGEEDDNRWLLYTKLGQALANAGRGRQAARAYGEAAAIAPASEVATLQQRAGDQLLRSGHIDEGIATLAPILKDKGIIVPSSPKQAVSSLWKARGELKLTRPRLGFRLQAESLVSSEDLAKMDLCWAAMIGVFNFDHLRGLLFHTQHLSLALQAGEPFRVARGLAVEALVLAGSGTSHDRVQATLDRAERIGRQVKHPYLHALVELISGSVALRQGRWPDAYAHHRHAEEQFRANCLGVTWELGTIRLVVGTSLFYSGRLRELSQEVEKSVQDARQRGDLYAQMCTQLGVLNVVRLLRDDVEGARRQMEVISKWSQKGFHLPHFFHYYSQVQADLYVGDCSKAFERIVATWPRITRSGLLRLQLSRIMMFDLRARSALAKTLQAEVDCAKLRRLVRADAKRLRKERVGWATALATLLEAQLQAQDTGEAIELFDKAARAFLKVHMPMHAGAARVCAASTLNAFGDSVDCKELESIIRKPREFLSIIAPAIRHI